MPTISDRNAVIPSIAVGTPTAHLRKKTPRATTLKGSPYVLMGARIQRAIQRTVVIPHPVGSNEPTAIERRRFHRPAVHDDRNGHDADNVSVNHLGIQSFAISTAQHDYILVYGLSGLPLETFKGSSNIKNLRI